MFKKDSLTIRICLTIDTNCGFSIQLLKEVFRLTVAEWILAFHHCQEWKTKIDEIFTWKEMSVNLKKEEFFFGVTESKQKIHIQLAIYEVKWWLVTMVTFSSSPKTCEMSLGVFLCTLRVPVRQCVWLCFGYVVEF